MFGYNQLFLGTLHAHFTYCIFDYKYYDKSTTVNAKWPSPARHHTSLFHSLSHLPSLSPTQCPPPPPLSPPLIEVVHSKGGGIKVRFEVIAQHCLVLRMRRIRLECCHVNQVHNKSMGIALRIRAESARWSCHYVIIPLYLSSYYYMCPYTTIIFVLIPLYMCPHTK